RLPEALEEDEVALDVVLGGALGGGADDDAAFLHLELLEDVLQARALVVVEPARDAEAFALRDEDDEAAGQRDLRRQACALRLHRILHGLDEDRLALADQVLDLAAVAALELRADDLVDVEEPVLLEADLDERGLHPGQDVVDLAEIDVAGDRAALRALEVDLGDPVVLEHGDALLADVDGDEQLALRLRQRRTALRLAPASLLALFALRGRALRLPLGRLPLLGLGRRGLLGRGLRLGGGRWRLLAAAPAARAAAALGLRIGCRPLLGGGRLDGYGVGGNGSGCLGRRLLVDVLATEPTQAKTPLMERATASSGGAG